MFHLLKRTTTLPTRGRRFFSNTKGFDSLVIGAYTEPTQLTTHVSHETRNLIQNQLALSRFKKQGDVRVFYDMGGVKQLAVVSLGEKKHQSKTKERESVRSATAIGIQTLQKQGATYTGVDVSVDIQAAAEGAVLAQFSFDKLKQDKKEVDNGVEPYAAGMDEARVEKHWEMGQIYGASQNVARMLMTSPANLMTPKLFAEEVAYLLAGLENVDIEVHDEDWVTRQNMNAFLSVSKGSEEPLRFMEIHYKGAENKEEKPYGLVGKGITFDSGGISLKPSANMALMKGDMGGAATVAGALYGICKMKLPVNIVAIIPLCENMPSGNATKPGDVVKAMNGKSIEVLNTDAEGRMILADALHYISSRFQPKHIIDLATLTGAIDVALGQVYAGVFTNSDKLWKQLETAGESVSDPFWRMPIHDDYVREMKQSLVADLSNVGFRRSGGSCAAAGFLKEFVGKDIPWAHIDIAGVMDCHATKGHHIKGMSGRPTRALIELMRTIQ
ncbi:cytosol aminopeptidase family, catalytic domain-containing protein [Mucor mucedo]|uniref:cytosol aminopeptidase family, catalytic domain-containing protein n=1 Tax=Mucor mucedo TaxID=29922 RepID=UPI00221EB02D|nr:cytosol aminopeptidase family, catalytic domain-containing protein [Mucor mucedo]KAI7893329.1 cytosol aminopeptidase family, catalytic domain-containing protein [Mucor mucedo]